MDLSVRGNARGVKRVVEDIERSIFRLPGDLRTRFTEREGWCFPSQTPDGPPGARGNRVIGAPPGTSTKALARLRARLTKKYYKGYMEIARGLPQEEEDDSALHDDSSGEDSSDTTSSSGSNRSPSRDRECAVDRITPLSFDKTVDESQSSSSGSPVSSRQESSPPQRARVSPPPRVPPRHDTALLAPPRGRNNDPTKHVSIVPFQSHDDAEIFPQASPLAGSHHASSPGRLSTDKPESSRPSVSRSLWPSVAPRQATEFPTSSQTSSRKFERCVPNKHFLPGHSVCTLTCTFEVLYLWSIPLDHASRLLTL